MRPRLAGDPAKPVPSLFHKVRGRMVVMPVNKSPYPHVTFHVDREEIDEDGYWNPTGEGSFSGGLQINIYGSKAHYCEACRSDSGVCGNRFIP